MFGRNQSLPRERSPKHDTIGLCITHDTRREQLHTAYSDAIINVIHKKLELMLGKSFSLLHDLITMDT